MMTNEEIRALQALAKAVGPGDFSAGDAADPLLQYAAMACQAVPTLCADLLAARAELTAIANAVDVPIPDGIEPTIVNAVKELHARVDEAHRRAAQARAEVERLRGALRPFANVADDWDKFGDHVSILMLLGDLRRARAALEGGQ